MVKLNEIINEDRILLCNKNWEMKYSKNNLIKEIDSEEKKEYLFFWGHTPDENGKIAKSCLSQWWKSNFTVEEEEYCCMEQFMMSEKARIFKDEKIRREILNEKNPKIIKELGRKVINFDEAVWREKRYLVILNGNFAKFMQNKELKEYLLSTKDKVIVEASPYDAIWGIGMSINEQTINNPYTWKGENLLGFALMEVRDEILKICKNKNEFIQGNFK